MTTTESLPIDAVVDDVRQALAGAGTAVLVAPPGAGKTTRVPLVLLHEPWLAARKILLVEPRRLAARAAAERMAGLLGESVGETVGLRARLNTQVGPKTRIEVITEGVFTRLILDDPSLETAGAVLFDEFHERSLDADLGLAFALDARGALREDLRLLVMSATLDVARVAGLLGNAPVIVSEGRTYPVETRYIGAPRDRRIVDAVTIAIERALRAEGGSVLAFLPGQAEIRRAAEQLRERIADAATDIVELHGTLDSSAQAAAIAPAAPGRRKVVLATAIAQTSITIEGVRIVVDSGLERVARYEPDVGLTRLETVRVSRATADQRRGRAGRTEPGICYRLWDEPQTAGLSPFTAPEVRSADLSGLLLDCAAWGVTDPASLRWLDPPAPGALSAARGDLDTLGALDAAGRLTKAGRHIRAMPLAPRLAHMLIEGTRRGAADTVAAIAALLSERGMGGRSTDLDDHLQSFMRDRSPRARNLLRLARDWAGMARRMTGEQSGSLPETAHSTASLLSLAYPDRIAKARGAPGQFLLANGRAAIVDASDPLAGAAYLVVAEMSGAATGARIQLAARLGEDELADIAGDRIEMHDDVSFDASACALRARRQKRLGAIVLSNEPLPVPRTPEAAGLLAEGVARIGIHRLPWSKGQQQLRHRVAFLRAAEGDASPWPDLSDPALERQAAEWLAPFLGGATALSEITAEHLAQAVDALLPYALRRRLDAEAPTHFEAPTGQRHAIDYESDGAPILAIRVQELYGLTEHPAIAGGQLPLTLHLLSPAGRPVQITRDLPGFWAGSWRDVRTEMKGRYPKHIWPEDPANARPTTRAKPRS